MIAAALTIGVGAAQPTGDAKAAAILEQARATLGGERALQQVTALSATGTVTRAAGSRQLSGGLVVRLQLPDRMLRTDSLSPDGGLTLETDQGIDGDRLLRAARTFNAPPGAVIRTPPPPARGSEAEAQALRAARADLVRLSVALLLRAPDARPLDFTYGGQAEAPDGKADVIDARARDDSSLAFRLFFDTTTHRLLMLSYRGVAPRLVVQANRAQGAPAAGGARPELPPPGGGEIVEIQTFFDDYRQVDGIMLPHHVSRSVAGEVTEEWTLESFAVNPAFKPATFEVR